MSKATTGTNENNDKKGKKEQQAAKPVVKKEASKYPLQWAKDCVKRHKINAKKWAESRCSVGNGLASIGTSRCAVMHLIIADATASKETLSPSILHNRTCALQIVLLGYDEDTVTTQSATNSHLNTLRKGRSGESFVRVDASIHFVATAQKEFMRDLKSSCV